MARRRGGGRWTTRDGVDTASRRQRAGAGDRQVAQVEDLLLQLVQAALQAQVLDPQRDPLDDREQADEEDAGQHAAEDHLGHRQGPCRPARSERERDLLPGVGQRHPEHDDRETRGEEEDQDPHDGSLPARAASRRSTTSRTAPWPPGRP